MFRVGYKYLSFLAFVAIIPVMVGTAVAQSDDKAAVPSDPKSSATVTVPPAQSQPADATDPLKRSPNAKQKKQQKRSLNVELSKTYKKWLNEDVVWIITDQERAAFKQLSNDEERDNFIEAFWQRRDPTPDTEENEYKEEHYRRIAYSNEHFAAGIPGWKSDRGRMYIMYGPPDEIDSHPSGGSYERPMEEGGGETSTYPFEDWRYRYLEGIGQEVIIEFVDTCMCGDYHMTLDRSEKDALKYTPNAGLTLYEQMGMASKADRFSTGGLEQLGTGPMGSDLQTKEFDRLEQFCEVASAASGEIQRSGRNRQHQDHHQPDAVRCARRFREGDRRHGAGADHHSDEVSRHNFREQGWSTAGHGKHFRPGEHADGTSRADLRGHGSSRCAGGVIAPHRREFVGLLEGTPPAARTL